MVAAIRSNLGASNRLLMAALERRFTLLVSTPMLIEYEAVMTRTEHLSASGLTPMRSASFSTPWPPPQSPFAWPFYGGRRCVIQMTTWCWKPPQMGERTPSSPSTNATSPRSPNDLASGCSRRAKP